MFLKPNNNFLNKTLKFAASFIIHDGILHDHAMKF